MSDRVSRECIRHGTCIPTGKEDVLTLDPGGPIRRFVVSLMGAVSVVAGLLVIRHHREADADAELKKQVPAGENTTRTVSLEQLRELGV